MIQFMVLGMPRSATTWCANWLTTDESLCIHDPLGSYPLDELDNVQSTRMLGVSCTGLAFFPEWLNKHPARKVILHRPVEEVKSSLLAHGFGAFNAPDLTKISGMHCNWTDVFTAPQSIYEFLLGLPFDGERHHHLKQMNVQVDWERVIIDPNAARKYLHAFARAIH